MFAIQVQNLSKSFLDGKSKIEVLRDISFQLEKGEFACIYGESGSGKSTLLNILATIDIADSGSIMIERVLLKDLHDKNKTAYFRRKHIGFVFQKHYLLSDLTLLENVMLPNILLGRSLQEAKERACFLLDKVGLYNRKDFYPNKISGGESQRVAIARAVVHTPKLVLADEPTGNLDEKNTDFFLDLLFSLQQSEGLTVLLVTHENRIREKTSNCYFLYQGLLEKEN